MCTHVKCLQAHANDCKSRASCSNLRGYGSYLLQCGGWTLQTVKKNSISCGPAHVHPSPKKLFSCFFRSGCYQASHHSATQSIPVKTSTMFTAIISPPQPRPHELQHQLRSNHHVYTSTMCTGADRFNITGGMRQGSMLRLWLFVAVLQWAMPNWSSDAASNVGFHLLDKRSYVFDLRFVGDKYVDLWWFLRRRVLKVHAVRRIVEGCSRNLTKHLCLYSWGATSPDRHNFTCGRLWICNLTCSRHRRSSIGTCVCFRTDMFTPF